MCYKCKLIFCFTTTGHHVNIWRFGLHMDRGYLRVHSLFITHVLCISSETFPSGSRWARRMLCGPFSHTRWRLTSPSPVLTPWRRGRITMFLTLLFAPFLFSTRTIWCTSSRGGLWVYQWRYMAIWIYHQHLWMVKQSHDHPPDKDGNNLQ